MSGQTARSEVAFDCVIKGFDRKLEGPTVSLVERILDEAGFDGCWTLRDSHRIRKKGRGRFSVIRLESRGGAKSIRIWCKPKGNDSCFEYSLYPPVEVAPEDAFSVLKRVNPVTLEVAESRSLPGAVLDRIMDLPTRMKAAPRLFEVTEAEPEVVQAESEAAEELSAAESDVPANEAEDSVEDAGQESAPEEKPEDTRSRSTPVLVIESNSDLWDRDVADRALMAIAFVAEDGFARKAEASSSMIRHLGIEQFANGGSECYRTVQGSMRALTMALWKKWRYIDRVRYSSDDGRGASDAIKGYKITPKGHKRLAAIRGSFGERANELLEGKAKQGVFEAFREAGVTATAAAGAVSPIDMDAIKGMVQRHEEAKRQIEEHDEVIGSLDSEIRSIGIELEGLESVEADRKRRLAEIQAEIKQIESKKEAVSKGLDKKREERRQWSDMREPHALELARIESILVGRGLGK